MSTVIYSFFVFFFFFVVFTLKHFWLLFDRRKFRSANEVYLHACAEHCPDNIDPNADIYCQWGPGPNLCDNLPRKRFSLMTHINDRHITSDSFKAAVQRRIANGPQTSVTQPVTIIKKPLPPNSTDNTTTGGGTASPTLSTSSNSSQSGGSSAAMQAIKRHSMDLINPKELMVNPQYLRNVLLSCIFLPPVFFLVRFALFFVLALSYIQVKIRRKKSANVYKKWFGQFQDENEGPVTKSIRLTASLILRNLVNYTTTAKR